MLPIVITKLERMGFICSGEDEMWTVVDLFSGAGGMSYGFNVHPHFKMIAAIDAEIGKPSSGEGSLQCNKTYKANIGIEPLSINLSCVEPKKLSEKLSLHMDGSSPTVLISCAPCTGFSRTLSKNHLKDDPRNSLVAKSAKFVKELRPKIFLMENARELIKGNYSHHFENLTKELNDLGYKMSGRIHFLNHFGLPQKRERALVIAVRNDLPMYTMDDLWEGFEVDEQATSVRYAISSSLPIKAGETHKDDQFHVSPKMSPKILRRLRLIPNDGGSWADIRDHKEAQEILTPAMLKYIAKGEFGSHPDVYGRLWWDRPAVTIKRECAHVGNGRYSHPEQDRLCSVREMAILQGFPKNFCFKTSSLSNMYRHIGDAVPPLISYQLAKVCEWILTGIKPHIKECILSNTHLSENNIATKPQKSFNFNNSYA